MTNAPPANRIMCNLKNKSHPSTNISTFVDKLASKLKTEDRFSSLAGRG